MIEKHTEDKRLLGALDYIDERFIAEVTESYKIFEPSDGKITAHRTLKISLRQFAALAACLILLSAAFPAVNYVVKVINSFAAGWGSEAISTTDDTRIDDEVETDVTNESTNYSIDIDFNSLPIQLKEEEITEIVCSFIESKNEDYYSYRYSVNCFGVYDNAYAVTINCSNLKPTFTKTVETVNELDFVYLTSKKMKIYKQGVFYSITDAFEQNILDAHSLKTLHDLYNNNLKYYMRGIYP